MSLDQVIALQIEGTSFSLADLNVLASIRNE
jgi:hypothetical protein